MYGTHFKNFNLQPTSVWDGVPLLNRPSQTVKPTKGGKHFIVGFPF